MNRTSDWDKHNTHKVERMEDDDADFVVPAPTNNDPPTYIVELAKSGRAECKKCEEKIDNKTVRVGVLVDGEWGLFTRWQHLHCTVFHRSIENAESIDGFQELGVEQKELVRQRVAESANEVDEDSLPVDPDELVRKAWDKPMDPPSDLLMPLLPYQKEGLGWMVNQELNDTHGGILADEMGMGKTIQAISLMLANRPDFSDFAQMREWAASDERHGGEANLAKGPTLIVLPTVAIRQWQTEIARFTRGGSLTVKVYHGSDRNTTVEDLTSVDVVLTSYKVLEIEYRKATAGTKVTCRICGKKFYPDKLRVHRKYFCGETAQRTEAQALTQKKKQRVVLPSANGHGRGRQAAAAEGESEAASSSEDSIARQKRQNKAQAEGKGKGRGKGRGKAAGNASSVKQKAGKADKPGKASAGESSATKKKAKGGSSKAAAPEDDPSTAKPSSNSRGGKGKKGKTVAIKAEPVSDEDEVIKQEGDARTPRQGGAKAKSTAAENGKRGKRSAGAEDSAEEAPEVVRGSASKKRPASAVATPSASKAPRSAGVGKGSAGSAGSAARGKRAPADAADNAADQPVSDPELGAVADGPALKRRSPRSLARVPRNYFNETTLVLSDEEGSDAGGRAMSVDSGGGSQGADDASEYGQSGSGSASAQEEEEDESDSLVDSDSDSQAGGKGRKKGATPSTNSRSGGSRTTGSRAKGGKSGGQRGTVVQSSDDDQGSEDDNAPPAPKGKRAAGGRSAPVRRAITATSSKGGKSAVKTEAVAGAEIDESDDSDYSSGSSSESSDGDSNSNSASGSDTEGGGDGGDADWQAALAAEEVEKDIQEALAEVARAQKRSKLPPAQSILHKISWFRVILDEAHLIKDRSTSTARAVFNLVSLNKWCLTGTPLQNRVGELYSLIRFLRIDPHAFYFCRSKDGCGCKSLHYRFTQSRCDECGHSVIQHYCHFNKHILNPIKRSGYVSEGRKAMLKLKQQVLDEILLRRTKTTRAEDIQLPPRIVRVRQERLDIKEEDFYSALYTQSQAQFNTYLASGTVLNNYAHIFDILIRLRQAVDHPYLVIYSDTQVAAQGDSDNFLSVGNGTVPAPDPEVAIKTEKGCCDLCHEPWEDPVSAECGHSFCRSCILDYIAAVGTANGNGAAADLGASAAVAGAMSPPGRRQGSRTAASATPNGRTGGGSAHSGEGVRCPDCHCPLTLDLEATPTAAKGNSVGMSRNTSSASITGSADPQGDGISVWDPVKGLGRRSILDRIDLNSFQSSTKIEALMEELHRMQQQDLGAKAIVFSQFVNMLDLINFRLQRGGLGCVKLSGNMNLEQRDRSINAFKNDPSVKVLLISLKAGGVALNLTVASRIFLMDPWWNPAAEMQAIDRTHRIGQHKPIFATRFIIENTIEERILRLQEKKKLVFDGTVGGDAGSMSKLTVDDMRFLFN